MLAGAVDRKWIVKGRILIPDYLKEYAGTFEGWVVAGLGISLRYGMSRNGSTIIEAESNSERIAEELGKIGRLLIFLKKVFKKQ